MEPKSKISCFFMIFRGLNLRIYLTEGHGRFWRMRYIQRDAPITNGLPRAMLEFTYGYVSITTLIFGRMFFFDKESSCQK